MVLSSSTLPSPLIASCKSSGWGLRYVTREWWGGVWGERLFSPHSPNLDLLGFTQPLFTRRSGTVGPG